MNDVLVNLVTSDMSPTVTSGDNATSFPRPGCVEHITCHSTYCSNHGNCVDLWTQNQCRCQSGFVGRQCSEQTMAHFSGRSFLHFSGQTVITDILLWISATSDSGIILYTVSIECECFQHIQVWHCSCKYLDILDESHV